jgi:VanZ family protein
MPVSEHPPSRSGDDDAPHDAIRRPRRPSQPGLWGGAASGASGAVSLWLPVIVWAAVIFAFSSIPSLGTGLGVWDTILRKGAHMSEYAILGVLLLRALGRELPALAVGIGYAISDEIHQHFVRGRHASPVDVLIDTIGLAIGVFIVSRLFQTRPVPGTGQVR